MSINNQNEIKKLSKEELRELQLKSLEILIYFRDFCDKHNLTFYLCGGCCIGAIRHKGFIPWDDDVDVFMPRKDYEKLIPLWNKYANTKRFSCNRTNKKEFMGNIMTTITDNNTKVIRPWQSGKDGHKGVMMDILPIDGCAPGGIRRKIQMFWSMIFSLYCSQMVPVNHGKIVTLVGKIMLGIVPFKKMRYKIWKFAEKQMSKYEIADSKYITELCSGPHYMRNKYPKEIFDKVVYMEFEKDVFPLPSGYDSYLKIAFGDYMQLPPKNKQIPHHDIIYLNLKEDK